MGFVLLLSHHFQGTENGLLLIKGFAEQNLTNNSLDSKLGVSYNGNENNTDTTNAEVSHIGFLKVHKAGSTTMQNMLFRFGLKRNPTFVIPESRNLYRNPVNTLPVKRGGHYVLTYLPFISRHFTRVYLMKYYRTTKSILL